MIGLSASLPNHKMEWSTVDVSCRPGYHGFMQATAGSGQAKRPRGGIDFPRNEQEYRGRCKVGSEADSSPHTDIYILLFGSEADSGLCAFSA
jgi:hypothetical protein